MKTPSGRSRTRKIRVAIVEDDDRLRRAFKDLLHGSDGLECTAGFSTCEAAIAAFHGEIPHVLLMDIGLPGMSGIEGTRRIKEQFPSINIMMLTVYDDDEKIFDSIQAGASGYLLKNAPPEELIRAIRDIQTGAPMSASIARRVLDLLRSGSGGMRNEADAALEYNLTRRELDILHALVEGLSDRRIGEKLFISPLTVHSHVKRIYEKLQVHSKPGAVSKALKQGLVR